MKNVIITIDGPAGVGKTTLARETAEALGLPYMATGAMFRFLALNLGSDALALPQAELLKAAGQWHFSLAGSGRQTRLLANGVKVGLEIRAEAVSALASALAKSPAIRNALLAAQRAMGEAGPLVAEGRDLGTVVFPQAAHKFFLDARPEVRAKRRFDELKAKGVHASLEEITGSMAQRDEQDRSRAIAPLKPAADAEIIDTSDLAVDQVLARILQSVRRLRNV